MGKKNHLLIWIAICLLATGVIFLGWYIISMKDQIRFLGSQVFRMQQDQLAQRYATVPFPLEIDGDPSIGKSNAQVTMVVFSDYACSYCKKFFDTTFPDLLREYITKGKLRLVIKEVPRTTHPELELASKAALFAHTKGVFWILHGKLFSKQEHLNELEIFSLVAQCGLDTAELKSRIVLDKCTSILNKNKKIAQDAGIYGIPAFVINQKLFVGYRDGHAISEIIEAALLVKIKEEETCN